MCERQPADRRGRQLRLIVVLVLLGGCLGPPRAQLPEPFQVGKYSVRFGRETRIDGTDITVPRRARAIAAIFAPLLPQGWRIEIASDAAIVRKCTELFAREPSIRIEFSSPGGIGGCWESFEKVIYSPDDPVDLLPLIKGVLEPPPAR